MQDYVQMMLVCLAPLWTLSYVDRDSSLVVTPDGLRCQSREQREWHGCRATKGVGYKGRYYYEATVTDEGLCRIGWSTPTVNKIYGIQQYM
jgi:ATP-dependent RNA helicase DDX1